MSDESADPQEEYAADTIIEYLESIDVEEVSVALQMLISAILGVRAYSHDEAFWSSKDWNARVLTPRVLHTPDEIEQRLRLAGLGLNGDPAGDPQDGALAEYFIRILNRTKRLLGYRSSLQVAFVGKCILALTCLYSVRKEAIDSLYKEEALELGGILKTLLDTIDQWDVRSASNSAASSSSSSSSSSSASAGKSATAGTRMRKRTGPVSSSSSSSSKSSSGDDDDHGPFDVSDITIDNIGSQPPIDGLKKVILIFQRLAASDDEEGGGFQDLQSKLARLATHPRGEIPMTPGSAIVFHKKLLAALNTNSAKELHEATTNSHQWRRYRPRSGFFPLVVAPLLVLSSVAFSLFVWIPVIYPSIFTTFPALKPMLDLSPQFEWIRFLATAGSVSAVFGLVFLIANYSPGRGMARYVASVHSFLAEDADVRALFSLSPTSIVAQRWAPGRGVLPPKSAASNEDDEQAHHDADAQEEGGGDEDEEEDNAMEELFAGFGEEDSTTETLIDSFHQAERIIAQVNAIASKNASTFAAAAASASLPSVEGGGGHAEEKDGDATAATPVVQSIALPPDIIPNLEFLVSKFVELGDTENMNCVAEALRFIQDRLVKVDEEEGDEGEEGEGEGGASAEEEEGGEGEEAKSDDEEALKVPISPSRVGKGTKA